MNELIENFHFLRPLWLLTLVIPIVFYLKYFKGSKNKSSWESVCDKNLLNFLLIRGSSKIRKSLGYIALTGVLATIIAIAGPTWSKKDIPNVIPENPVMILLNLSTDMSETDVKPNRLAAAKYKISDFLKDLKQAEAGLIVYTNEPFLITPITEDTNLLINLLSSIDTDIMPTNGDRLDRAIELATNKMKDSGFRTGNIVIFSADVGQKFDLALRAAKQAETFGYKISIINMSTQNSEKLELVAKNASGAYYSYKIDDSDIDTISEKINQNLDTILKKSENLSSVWEEYGYYLSIIPLLCCLSFFRKGIFILLFVMSFSNVAHAGFFENTNQEGLRYYKSGRYEKASKSFEDTRWLGTTYYRLGDYDKAYQEFAKSNTINAVYNQGNALAKSGKIEDAIKKYEEVLGKDPKHKRAKFNLEYLKKLQNEQQQQQQNSQDENQEQNNDEENQNENEQNQQQNGSENQDNQDNQNQNKENAEQQNGQDQQQKDTNSEKNEENSDSGQKEEQQSQQQSSGADDNKNEQKSQAQQQQVQSKQAQESDAKEQEAGEGLAEKEDAKGEEDWSEAMQAKEQQYRDIPENPGGLLRAFIHKEYSKNRYNDE